MIRPTQDMTEVNRILHHPSIWKDIADGEPFDTPYLPDVLYLMVNNDEGVITFHRFRDGLKIHPNILPEKRGKMAYQAVEDAIQYVFSLGWTTIYAEIDVRLRHVIRFAKDLGFNSIDVGSRNLLTRRRLDS